MAIVIRAKSDSQFSGRDAVLTRDEVRAGLHAVPLPAQLQSFVAEMVAYSRFFGMEGAKGISRNRKHMNMIKTVLAGAAVLTMTAANGATTERSYSASNFALELGGVQS